MFEPHGYAQELIDNVNRCSVLVMLGSKFEDVFENGYIYDLWHKLDELEDKDRDNNRYYICLKLAGMRRLYKLMSLLDGLEHNN